jgi:hypothetical protein
MDWIELADYKDRWRAVVKVAMNFRVPLKCEEFFDYLKTGSSSSVGATARCGLWPVEQHLSIFPIFHQLCSSFHSHHLEISFCFFSPSFPGSYFSSRTFQFSSVDLFGHPILLHSFQVTQPTYPLPLYPFYYIFSFTQLF